MRPAQLLESLSSLAPAQPLRSSRGSVPEGFGDHAPGHLQNDYAVSNLRHGSTTGIDKFQNCIPAAGKFRSVLTGTNTPTGLRRRGAASEPLLPTGQARLGAPGFVLLRASQRTLASDGTSPSGSPGFVLPRCSPRTSASDGASPSGSSGFVLPRCSPRTLASDGASPSGSSGLALPQASRRTSASDGASPSGSPEVSRCRGVALEPLLQTGRARLGVWICCRPAVICYDGIQMPVPAECTVDRLGVSVYCADVGDFLDAFVWKQWLCRSGKRLGGRTFRAGVG